MNSIHTAAWWCWAGGLAAAGLGTTNPAITVGLLLAAAVVTRVAQPIRREDDPVRAFLRLALIVVTVKVVLQAVFAPRTGGTVLLRLPELVLPDWAAGVRFGGPVTAEGLVMALRTGAQLAVVLVAFGAANALTSPVRLLRLLPRSLYEIGVAATVALSTAPHALSTARGLRDARRLRGRATRGWRGLSRSLVPTLELTLARSVELAASMDVRGFGRRTAPTPTPPARVVVLGLAFGGVAVGLYATFSPGQPRWMALVAVLGATVAFVTVAGSARSVRTRYRPERWTPRGAVVATSGALCAGLIWLAGALDPGVVDPPVEPLGWPAVSVVAALAVAAAVVPVVAVGLRPELRSEADPGADP